MLVYMKKKSLDIITQEKQDKINISHTDSVYTRWKSSWSKWIATPSLYSLMSINLGLVMLEMVSALLLVTDTEELDHGASVETPMNWLSWESVWKALNLISSLADLLSFLVGGAMMGVWPSSMLITIDIWGLREGDAPVHKRAKSSICCASFFE